MTDTANTQNWDTNKHPAGLYVLFFTEMWERFSYYGMRAILIYYMMKQLMFTQENASSIYGYYSGLVYLTPFFGGIIADRWLGQRRSVIIGGLLMAAGQFTLMFQQLFFPGLALLILGNGAFKPNISTQVGNLYPAGDRRRDSAFSIFYVGINVGAFFSPLICGTLGEMYGWKYGFMSAGVGMLVGLAVYMWGQKHLSADNIMKTSVSAEQKASQKLDSSAKSKIVALIVLAIFNIMFWAVYEQQGNTLALWADANTDRHIFGWEMPASWVQSLNPAMIAMLTPMVVGIWAYQGKRKKEPSSIAKMGIGCALLGIAFLVLIPPARSFAANGQPVSIGWIALCITILTVGELYLSPVGLSLVTKLSPAWMVSMMMGVWFLSSAAAGPLTGQLGTLWSKMSKENFFMLMAGLSFAVAIGFFAMLKPLKKAIGHGEKEPVDI
jgi:POT family proton-dependent oligopeptide transporter